MRLLIDILGCVTESRTRGIGRYSKDLIVRLSKDMAEHELHLLVNYQDPVSAKEFLRDFRDIVKPQNIHNWSPLPSSDPFDLSSDKFRLSEEMYKAAILNVAPDALIFTEPLTQGVSVLDLTSDGIACYPIIYDLIPIIYPEDYLTNPKQFSWYQEKISAMKGMTGILTISDSSKKEILEIVENENVINIGCDTSFNPNLHSEGFTSINEFDFQGEDFILYTGGFDYRKSVDLLLQAFAKLKEFTNNNLKLVLAGKIPEMQKAALIMLAKKLNCEKSIGFLGFVSDSELSWLYRNCKVFVNPSKHEGFGLPVLEAMRAGAPVLVADNTNHAEMVKSKEAKFETGNLDDFFEKLKAIYSDASLRDKLIQSGTDESKNHSWEAVAKKTLQQLEKIPKKVLSIDDAPYESLVSSIQKLGLPDNDLKDLARKLNVTEYFSDSQPRLYIDISILIQVDAKSGVQRVVRSITRELWQNQDTGYKICPIYFSPIDGGFLIADSVKVDGELCFKTNLTSTVSRVDFRNSDVFLGLDLNHNWVVNHKAAFTHVANSPARCYFVLYDLLPIKYPDFFDPIHNLVELHTEWLASLVLADGAIAISQAVADEYEDYIVKQIGGLPKNFKNESFCLGSDIQSMTSAVNSLLSEEFPDRFKQIAVGDGEFTLLMVGTVEPRKDYRSVLNAMELIWSDTDFNFNLVIVGKVGWRMADFESQIIGHKEVGKRLFWFNSLSDRGLSQLYGMSNGLIAASIDEGFGLPIIEAARNNLPVLARDIPVFREVGGSGVSYFNDDSPSAFSKEIKSWIQRVESREIPDIKNVRPISWKESAQQLLNKIL